jgi:hypothetical protein
MGQGKYGRKDHQEKSTHDRIKTEGGFQKIEKRPGEAKPDGYP